MKYLLLAAAPGAPGEATPAPAATPEAASPGHTGATPGAHGGHVTPPMAPDAQMLIWTIVVFALIATILYKFAFQRICQALDQREETIRRAVEEADRVRQELDRIEQTRAQRVAEAEQEAKAIVEESRHAAREAGRVIEDKARQEAQILVENATREIKIAQESARGELREESAKLAVALALRVLDERFDEERHQQLVDKLIQEV